MDLQMAWKTKKTVWVVHFADRIGGKLATFTVDNLKANASYALITAALLSVFYLLCCCVSPWRSDLCMPRCAGTERKNGTDAGESTRCSVSTVRARIGRPKFLTCQKFIWPSGDHLGADDRPSLPLVHFMAEDAWPSLNSVWLKNESCSSVIELKTG